jgi:hypothetical protein
MNGANLYFRIIPLLLCLSACSHLAMQGDGLPLESGAFDLNLPVDHEMQAVLTITAGGVREDYLLAISTLQGEFSGALLTAQGIPVYSVKVLGGRLSTSRQVSTVKLLDSVTLLRYLELIYLNESKIRGRIRDHWAWNAGKDERNFYHGDTSNTHDRLSIRYTGSAPWYSSVVLSVPDQHQILSLRVLETSIVVSE